MPVVYLSPYYSMLDYALALEGVYGFRHFDRYGNTQAIFTGYKAYEPAGVPVGDATQVVTLGRKFWTAGIGSSTYWGDGFKPLNVMYLDGDSSYSNVTILLHGEGTNGSTTVTNEAALAVTNTGVTTSTAQKKFGSSSLYFNGTTNYFNITQAWNSPSTLEMWVYPTAYNASNSWLVETANGGYEVGVGINPTGKLFLYNYGNPDTNGDSGLDVPLNQWSHIAIACTSGAWRLYVNGVFGRSHNVASFGSMMAFGRSTRSGAYFQGYMDDIRFTNGVNRYPVTCDVPTAAFYSRGLNTPVFNGSTPKGFEKVFKFASEQEVDGNAAVASYVPLSSIVMGTAAEPPVKFKSEQEVSLANIYMPYMGYGLSTAIAPLKQDNPIETATWNCGGTSGESQTNISGSWSWYATAMTSPFISSGVIYYELRHGGSTTNYNTQLLFGFTSGTNGGPDNAVSLVTNNSPPCAYGTDVLISPAVPTKPATSVYQFVCNPNLFASINGTEKVGALLDISAGTITFFYQGTVIGSIYGIPSGRSWSPFILSGVGSLWYIDYAKSYWTFAQSASAFFPGYSPGGVVSGYATDGANYKPAFYQDIDIATATATLSPAWVPGLGSIATNSANSYMKFYESYDIALARATGVKAFPPIGGAYLPDLTDPYYNNVVLLMHMEGANGGTTFTDEMGHIPSNVWSSTIDTAIKKFGGSSLQCGADRGLTFNSSDFDFGSNDFTIECWLYQTVYQSDAVIFGPWYATVEIPQRIMMARVNSSTNITVYLNGGAATVVSSTVPALETWTHFAVTKEGSTVRVFLDGVLGGATTGVANFATGKTYFTIGKESPITSDSSGNYWPGRIDEFRITKGVARYTGNFVVPATPFSHILGTTRTDNSAIQPTNAKMWYYAPDGSLATATATPAFAPPNQLGAIGIKGPNKVEDEVDLTNIRQLYLPTVSTAIAPVVSYNPFEGATLNDGTLNYTSSGWGWRWCNVSSSIADSKLVNKKMYFELVDSSPNGYVTFGFVQSTTTNPANSQNYELTTLTLANSPYNGAGRTEFCCYNISTAGYSAGNVLSALADFDAKTISFYRNGVLLGSYNNIPDGIVLKPAFSLTQNDNVTARFNAASWTKAAVIGYTTIISPGGVVSGFATGIEAEVPQAEIGDAAPALVYVPIYSPLSVPSTGVENYACKIEDEVAITPISMNYLATISTATNPVKQNLLEGLTFNNGYLYSYGGTSGTWYANWTIPIIQNNAGYFEVVFPSGTTTCMFGFTRGNGYPSNGSNASTAYTGYSYINAQGVSYDASTQPTLFDLTIYPDNIGSASVAGDVWSMVLDVRSSVGTERTLKFFRNGVYFAQYYNLPAGAAWRACVNSYSNNYVYARFNTASWTKAAQILLSETTAGRLAPIYLEYSPASTSSGFATGISTLPIKEETESDVTHIAVDYLGSTSTAVAPVKNGNILEGALLTNGVLSLTASGSVWNSEFTKFSYAIPFYFEVRVDTVSSLMLGITCGNTCPYGSYFSFTTSTSGVMNGTDVVIYANVMRGLTVGDIYGVQVDTLAGTMKIYLNGSIYCTFTGLQTALPWRPCFSLHAATASMRFNLASWSYSSLGATTLGATSPGGAVTGFGTGVQNYAVKIEDEINITPIARVFDGYGVSTAVAPPKWVNAFEGAANNQTGTTQIYNYYGNNTWSSANIATTKITSGRHYFEVGTPQQAISAYFGFTYSANGAPGGGGTYGTNYSMSGADFAYNINTNNNNDRWSCILDLDKLKIYFYYNGSLLNSYTVPAGQSWLACYSGYFTQGTNNQSLFAYLNRASWTYANTIGYVPVDYSPGGAVTGYGDNVITDRYQPMNIIGSYTYDNPFVAQQAMYDMHTMVYVSDDTPWGSSKAVWASSQTTNIAPRNPKFDQDAANLIWKSLNTQTFSDFWGEQEPSTVNCSKQGVVTPMDHALDTSHLIVDDVARTRVATNSVDYRGKFEQVAGVDVLTNRLVYWNANYEATLYPLNPHPAVGLSNTLSNSVG